MLVGVVAAAIIASCTSAALAAAAPGDPSTPSPAASAPSWLSSLSSTTCATNDPYGAMGWISNLVGAVINPVFGWTAESLKYGRGLFYALAPVEVAWFVIHVAIKRRSVEELITQVAFKATSMLLFLGMMNLAGGAFGEYAVRDILDAFMRAGASIGSGGAADAPTSAITLQTSVASIISTGICEGVDVVAIPLQSTFQAHGLNIFAIGQGVVNLQFAMPFILLAILGIVAVYGTLAVQLFMTIFEYAVVSSAGVFLLGFSATRWTLPFAQSYWKYAFGIAIKLFVIEIISGLVVTLVGGVMAEAEKHQIDGLLQVPAYLLIIFVCILATILALRVPTVSATFLSGAPNLGAGAAVTMAVEMAAAAAVVASAGAAVAQAAAARSAAGGAVGRVSAGGAGAAERGAGTGSAPTGGGGDPLSPPCPRGGSGRGGAALSRATGTLQKEQGHAVAPEIPMSHHRPD